MVIRDQGSGDLFFSSEGGEFLFHGGVAVGEFFDGDVLGFVVGEAEVVL